MRRARGATYVVAPDRFELRQAPQAQPKLSTGARLFLLYECPDDHLPSMNFWQTGRWPRLPHRPRFRDCYWDEKNHVGITQELFTSPTRIPVIVVDVDSVIEA